MTATATAPIRQRISAEDWAALCRCERTLHRWSEQCCNHDIDEQEDGTVIARFMSPTGYISHPQRIPNRRAGAIKRAERIAATYGLAAYEQGDPRGCALYLYDPGDLGSRDIDSCYSSIGAAVIK
jgi:hypothetical protein